VAAIERTTPQSTFRTVEGVEMHAVAAGAGPTIVLLHPEPGDASTFAAVTPRLADGYRVFALDLRGHGASAKPRGDYSVATQAAYVMRFLDAVGSRRVVLVGNSYGAIVALHIAAHAPELVRALVLSGTCAYSDYHLPWRARLLSSGVGRLLAPVVPLRAIVREYRAQFADPSGVSTEQIDSVRAAFTDRGSRRVLWQQAHQLDFSAIESLLGRIAAPTLLLWGQNDPATPPYWARRFERDLMDARLVLIDHCGHYPPLEQPEAFCRYTREFVATLGP
jgi:pimeloyl-ACP methyl ester carboxylesterase